MTDVLRSRGPGAGAGSGDGSDRPASVVGGALLAAGGAAVSGLAVLAAVVLVAWVTDARGGASAGAAIRAAADAWLIAQGGSLRIAAGTVAVVPLGLAVLPAVLLYRAGASLARTAAVGDLAAAARATGVLAGMYGVLAAGVAAAAATPTARVVPVSAGLGALLLAALAGGTGVVRAADLGGALAAALPRPVLPVARAAGAGVAALLAAGAAVAAVALAAHGSRVTELTRALDPGTVGGLLLLVVGMLLAPNAVVWAGAYVAGPGFAVGTGTAVSPFGVTLGPVPALPLLAALPQGDPPPDAVRAVLVLPLVAGVLAGVVLARGVDADLPARARAGWGALTGLAAGAVTALLATLSGGPAGGGYLTAVGPSPWQVALAVTVEIGVPAALVVAVAPTRPASEPAATSPRSARPGRPSAARSAVDGPTADHPTADHPTADHPTADHPTAGGAAADRPAGTRPAAGPGGPHRTSGVETRCRAASPATRSLPLDERGDFLGHGRPVRFG